MSEKHEEVPPPYGYNGPPMPQPAPYGGSYGPPAPYPPAPQPQAPPHTTTVITVPGQQFATGSCPICHRGNFNSEFTCCGIVCAILFFPIGILCCMCMMEKRCTNCGYSP